MSAQYAIACPQTAQDCFARCLRTRARVSSLRRFSSILASLTVCASTSLARCASSRSSVACSDGVRSGDIGARFRQTSRTNPPILHVAQGICGNRLVTIKVNRLAGSEPANVGVEHRTPAQRPAPAYGSFGKFGHFFRANCSGHLNSPLWWRVEARPVGLGGSDVALGGAREAVVINDKRGALADASLDVSPLCLGQVRDLVDASGFKKLVDACHFVSPLLMHPCNANPRYRSSHKMHQSQIISTTPRAGEQEQG
jgi:hypothetical protein